MNLISSGKGEYNYDLKSDIYYGLSYDNQYLYVSLKTADIVQKRKIMMAGLSFWIDTNAKGKEQLGLMFPLQQKSNPGDMRNMNSGPQGTETERKKSSAGIKEFNEHYLNNLALMDFIGFGGDAELSTSGNINKNGISAILHIDTTEFLYYFASIPLGLIFNSPEDYLNNPDNQFSFSFKTNVLERPSNGMGGSGPSMGGGPSGSGGGPSGGGGRPQGGGHPIGSGAPPETEQMQAMSQPTVITVKKAVLSPSE